jgi:pSer/pThr/pTyr-binding forkhead associated (FHA) protein
MASISFTVDGVEQKFPLEAGTVTLGRGLESDIRLKDIKASRRHCQIVRTAQGYQVLDLSSGNGTFVNGAQVKQHLLKPGDRIQVGSTVITFHDGEAAPPRTSPASAPTAADRQRASAATAVGAKAVAAATATTARASGAGGSISVASTRKITGRMPAASPSTQPLPKAGTQAMGKAATQPVAKAATQPVAKAGTQAVSKTATGSVRKPTTQRTGTARSVTGKVSATQRFHAEASRKKQNPVVLLIGGIGAVFLLVVGFILFGGGEDESIFRHKLSTLTQEATRLEDAGQLDAAVQKFKEALSLIEGNERYKSTAAELRARIKTIADQKELLGLANKRFAEFEEKFKAVTDKEAAALLQEGKKLLADYERASLPWFPTLQDYLKRLERLIETKRREDQRNDFQFLRNQYNDDFKLGDRSQAQFSKAIAAWREFIKKGEAPSDARQKAEQEIVNINRQALAELDTLQKRAERLAESGKKAEALDLLKLQQGRFELTDHFEKLQKLIRQYAE